MKKIIDYETDYGYIFCNLKYLMDEQGISINMMSRLSKIKYDVVKRYYYNEIYQVDLQILAKFCYVFGCEISDMLIYSKSIVKQGFSTDLCIQKSL